jgi:hypothetical protein
MGNLAEKIEKLHPHSSAPPLAPASHPSHRFSVVRHFTRIKCNWKFVHGSFTIDKSESSVNLFPCWYVARILWHHIGAPSSQDEAQKKWILAILAILLVDDRSRAISLAKIETHRSSLGVRKRSFVVSEIISMFLIIKKDQNSEDCQLNRYSANESWISTRFDSNLRNEGRISFSCDATRDFYHVNHIEFYSIALITNSISIRVAKKIFCAFSTTYKIGLKLGILARSLKFLFHFFLSATYRDDGPTGWNKK